MTYHGWTRSALFAGALAGFLAAPWAGLAQSLNFAAGEDENPIQVVADNGIEWQQENMVFLARGNAVATRGTTQVAAQVLRAYYRETRDQGTQVWRLDAEGGVTITAPGETATGDRGVYDVDNGIFVLSGGKRVVFETEEDSVSASEQLEYWQNKQMAVARGDALAVRADKRLRADVLVAHFRPDKRGKTRVHRIEAFDNVRIKTETDRVKADRGIYNVESGIATLTGSVTLTRGSNTLSGCSAEVNLNTGISKLHSCKSAPGTRKRVQGVLVPDRAEKDAKTGN